MVVLDIGLRLFTTTVALSFDCLSNVIRVRSRSFFDVVDALSLLGVHQMLSINLFDTKSLVFFHLQTLVCGMK